MHKTTLGLLLWCAALSASAQSVISAGRATYASEPPAYKARTDEHGGFNASRMLTRKIYCDEAAGRPIPTNDWWTDIINNRFSGSLWSYPAMLRTGDYGVQVNRPSYWADEGKEMKSRSGVTVSAVKFSPEATIATDWSDWSVVFRMPDTSPGGGELRVTAVHGQPFTWFEARDLTLEISTSEVAGQFGRDDAAGRMGLRLGDDLYGLYYPAGTEVSTHDGRLRLPDASWAVVALLTSADDLEGLAEYAVSVPRRTQVDWNYDQDRALVKTSWSVTAENLRDPGAPAPVMQGFLPHAYKYAVNAGMRYAGHDYMTPRGRMRMYESENGTFSYDYRFSGMMPAYAAPSADVPGEHPYRQTVMDELMQAYAAAGTFGADTYWGGKGLVQMAMNMSFARQCGNEEVYRSSLAKLRTAMTDWLTYTPGEDNTFFSYYPRWGSMLGFDVSYDSDAFNDHHFHYGYFTYAAALLCMEDPQFAADYGELLTMIAKDYANWDREDARFPFMRTFDPWTGHSWAGGLGDAGNDNGNGQESTSEAMQSWGGLFLLGEALGNRAMRDAGLWGWNTEARATREYWFDVDAPRPANAGGRQAWPGKGDRQGNYDYSQYKYAYNSNITGKGIGWWTWFGGDPLFMHGIQWMPVSPALDYLSWDTDFVAWAYDDMMRGANSTFSHDWFRHTTNTDNGEDIQPLADNDWGNVTLAYMQRAFPEDAAAIFDRAYDEGRHIARSVSTSHISYYLIHHHRTYGELDNSVYSDCPTSSVYVRNGVATYMVYNGSDADRKVSFYRDGALIKTVTAPARRLSAISADPVATALELKCADGLILPPGDVTTLDARVLDQYGAGMEGAGEIVYSVSPANAAAVGSDGRLSVASGAVRGTKYTVTASCGDVSAQLRFTVNDRPATRSAYISPLPQFIEAGSEVALEFVTVDQYGTATTPADTRWSISRDGETAGTDAIFTPQRAGTYTAEAVSAAGSASTQFFVTPSMPNIASGATAVSSSEENAGSLTQSAIDGDRGSRWGSAHSDAQWLAVDLGEDCFLSRAVIDWEAAYGADYDLQTAPDGCAMTTVAVNYGGRLITVTVPAEDEWTTVAEVRGNSSAGTRATALGATGRWLRMKGISRGSQYGYSIYEMEIFGLPLSTRPDQLIGIDIDLPVTMDQGDTVTLGATSYTLTGHAAEARVQWSSDRHATFDGNDFTPGDYGRYTLTATTDAGFSSQASVYVNESTRLRELVLSPTEAQTLQSDCVEIEVSGTDQFGGVYPLDESKLTVRVLGADGKPVDASVASYDLASATFCSERTGVYTVSFTCGKCSATATVKVLDIAQANLALDKPATASAATGGNTAAMAVDGDAATRWESPQTDGEWLAVDLRGSFVLNRVTLLWESAFAGEYRIQVSSDGDNWTDVYATAEGNGGTEAVSFAPVPAAMVRLCCDRRATAYGNSVYELEVYGTERFDAADDFTPPVINKFECMPGNGTVDVLAAATDAADFVFYTFTLVNSQGYVMDTSTCYAGGGSEVGCRFGGLQDGFDYTVTVTAADAFGNSVSQQTAVTGIRDITGVNLALNRPVEASSRENEGIGASKAVDGDYDTRWGSEFNDDESITVDLGDVYSIVNVRIYWDDVAYATHYTVHLSADGELWQTFFSRSGWSGSTMRMAGKLDDYTSDTGQYGRYVRLTGHRRATGYGTSVKELEVYGDNDFSQITGVEDVAVDTGTSVDVYDTRGVLVRRGAPSAGATDGLPRGFYIIRGRVVAVR